MNDRRRMMDDEGEDDDVVVAVAVDLQLASRSHSNFGLTKS